MWQRGRGSPGVRNAREVHGVPRVNDFGADIGGDGLYINPLILGLRLGSFMIHGRSGSLP